jgi:hypothetical protein
MEVLLQQRFGLECFFIYVNCGRRQERRGRKYSKGVVSEKEGMGEKFTRNADQDQSSLSAVTMVRSHCGLEKNDKCDAAGARRPRRDNQEPPLIGGQTGAPLT